MLRRGQAGHCGVVVFPLFLDTDVPASGAFRSYGGSSATREHIQHRLSLLRVGADQMLECGAAWFDKPASLEEARGQLRALGGREHILVTAAAVVRDEQVLWRRVEQPRVALRRFSDAFLDFYLDAIGNRALLSIGGYELEGLGAQLVERVEGDYFAILGLPLLPLLAFLRAEGALRA